MSSALEQYLIYVTLPSGLTALGLGHVNTACRCIKHFIIVVIIRDQHAVLVVCTGILILYGSCWYTGRY